MISNDISLSRRGFLRGTGVALGLPWLESIRAWGAAEPAPKSNAAPRRTAVVFMGNGVNPHHWGAEQTPEGMVLKDSLRPLEPLKKQLLVFQGLWNPTTVDGPGGHFPKMNLLAGVKVKQTTTDIEVGLTMDQLMARQLGNATPVPSLVLGTEGPGYGTDSGYTSIYSAYLSWSSPTTPAPKEIYPQQAFDQLFDDGSKRRRDKSILDLVSSEAQSLRRVLSKRDQVKMEEYLGSVRELEQRIERADQFSNKETGGTGWHPTVRVATLMLNNDLSGMNFGYLGGITGGLHELSHHANDPARLAMYQKANEYHMKLWARALTKMQETNEGERTLLENSMVMFCSSLYDGNAHDSRKLPVLLAGGGGGTIRGGRMLDYTNDPNRKLCRLHLAMMERMGVPLHQFGDAETALGELS